MCHVRCLRLEIVMLVRYVRGLVATFELITDFFAAPVCTCENGTPATGDECTSNGPKCIKCEDNYDINDAKTACEGIGLIPCERALRLKPARSKNICVCVCVCVCVTCGACVWNNVM